MLQSITNNNNSMANDDERVVRHSGRAHIRGKIRRIWRPRYLELMDNGLVRYYECDDEQVVDDRNHIHMIPKSTLQVYQARIIDVTTLRDVHVGLPRGTFGVLFHARKLVVSGGADCGGTNPNDSLAPRDYLCAVPTLEEAQSWVVALQWASSMQILDYEDVFDDLEQEPTSGQSPLMVVTTTPKRKHTKATTRQQQEQQPKAGKIVVPKVQRVSAVRTGTMSFDIAYEIQLLVLSSKKTAEERILLRTRAQLASLWDALHQQQVISKSSSKSVLESVRRKFDSVHPKSYRSFVETIPIMDSILRTVAMDAYICNSAALRTFWSLDDDDAVVVIPQPLLQPHVDNSIVLQRVHNISATTTTDQFVKTWVAQRTTQEQATKLKAIMYWLLQRPVVFAGILVAPLLLLSPLKKVRKWFGSVTLPVDVLVLSWLLALFLGKEVEKKKRTKQRDEGVPIQSSVPTIVDGGTLGDDTDSYLDVSVSTDDDEGDTEDLEVARSAAAVQAPDSRLSSPLPQYPDNNGLSCWSKPSDNIFRVRSATYLQDRVKLPSGPAPFQCRGVDFWLTDNAERHIARHPHVLGGRLEEEDTFLVNFLLPFGNFVAYFGIPPIDKFPKKLANVWTKFINGNQQYRDARLKLLPVVIDGPWIVKAAVGPGTSPALLGKVIPLQYYFRPPTETTKGIYEVDVIITASTIAKGILSVVKGNTKALTIAFGFIIEAAEEEELPETVLCNCQIHHLNLEECPQLPYCDLDERSSEVTKL